MGSLHAKTQTANYLQIAFTDIGGGTGHPKCRLSTSVKGSRPAGLNKVRDGENLSHTFVIYYLYIVHLVF